MRLRGCLVEAERLLDVHGHQNSAVEKLRDFNRFADLRIQQKVEAVFKKMRGSSASSFVCHDGSARRSYLWLFSSKESLKHALFFGNRRIKDSQTRKLK